MRLRASRMLIAGPIRRRQISLTCSEDFPQARFVHIIRGVVLSPEKRGWSRPLPVGWKQRAASGRVVLGWIVGKGRRYGTMLGSRYMELRYEDLVPKPRRTRTRIARPLNMTSM